MSRFYHLSSIIFCFVLTVSLALPLVGRSQEYEILNLTPGGHYGRAFAMNQSGQVVGLAGTAESGNTYVLWQPDGGMETQGTQPVNDINDLGQMAGQEVFSMSCSGCPAGSLSGNPTLAALLPGPVNAGWTGGCCMGSLGCKFCLSQAQGLNNMGVVVGYSEFPGSDGERHAFLWNGAIQDLGVMAGDAKSQANAVNDNGLVVGFSQNGTSSLYTAVTWIGGVIQPLPRLVDGYPSRAWDVNNNGLIVGEAANFTTGSTWRAVCWDGGIQDLGVTGVARGVNEAGQIVIEGMSGTAYLWKEGELHNLFDLIPADHGWDRFYPVAINDAGMIAGSARVGPSYVDYRAVVLVPVQETYSVSGTVLDETGASLEGVTVLSDSGESTVTGVNGTYELLVAEAGDFNITPSLEGWSFAPSFQQITVPPDVTEINFTATQEPAGWILAGTILDLDGAPIEGVAISTQMLDSAVTGPDGCYEISVDEAGNYTLTPTLDGFLFDPPSRTTTVPPDAANQDFAAVQPSISGRVLDEAGCPVVDVEISTGSGETAITDSEGNYTLNLSAAGTYSVTPEKPGCTFDPGERDVTVPPNALDQDFTATVTRLEVLGLEVTQSVQDWANSVPLMENKPTRVLAHVRGTTGEKMKAVARLDAFRNGARVPGFPMCTDESGNFPWYGPPAYSRGDEGVAMFKLLDPGMIQGNVEFRVDGVAIDGISEELDCSHASSDLLSCSESAGPVSSDCSVSVTFQAETPPLRLKLLSVRLTHADGKTKTGPTQADLMQVARNLKALFPLTQLDVKTGSVTYDGDPFDIVELNRLMSDMQALQEPTRFVLGIVWDHVFNKDGIHYSGWADGIPGTALTVSIVSDLRARERNTPAHELGHLLGLQHVVHSEMDMFSWCDTDSYKCGWCKERAERSVQDWPYGWAYIGPTILNGAEVDQEIHFYDMLSHYYGLPTNNFALMSYCPAIDKKFRYNWISKLNYEKLRDVITEHSGLPWRVWGEGEQSAVSLDAETPVEVPADFGPSGGRFHVQGLNDTGAHLVFRGFLDLESGAVEMAPVIPFSTQEPLTYPAVSDYSLKLWDDEGELLTEIPFVPRRNHGDTFDPEEASDPPAIATFFVPVPADPEVAAVEVRHHETALANLSRSGNAPTVQILSPNGGEVLEEETVRVEWTAEDPDGDPLTFSLYYSPDDGAHWESLAMDLTNTVFEVGRAWLQGTAAGLFRITAGDGFNSASDASNAPFVVADNPPVLHISDPVQGALYFSGQQILFTGEAWDREDGEISGDHLYWSSSLGGDLGTGSPLILTALDLSEGEHLITASVTDSVGNSAMDSATVRVAREAPDSLADVMIIEEVSDRVPDTGDRITFTLTLFNAGPDDALGVMTEDYLPGDLAFLAVRSDEADCSENEGVVTCSLGYLPVNMEATVEIDTLAEGTGTCVNVAQVFSQETDPALDNNEARVEISVRPREDRDEDGVPDLQDNCPDTPNPGQEVCVNELEPDGQGDLCDLDDDNDGTPDTDEIKACRCDPDPTCGAPWKPMSTASREKSSGYQSFSEILFVFLLPLMVVYLLRLSKRTQSGRSFK